MIWYPLSKKTIQTGGEEGAEIPKLNVRSELFNHNKVL